MSTRIRPETSRKKEHWISKHRYYELKHFVMQYDDWKEALREMESSLVSTPPMYHDKVQIGVVSDPTGEKATQAIIFQKNMNIVMTAARDTGKLGYQVFRNVVEDKPWNEFKSGTLSSRDEYYKAYRKFFWLLDHYKNLSEVQ